MLECDFRKKTFDLRPVTITGVDQKLELCRRTLEAKSFRLSRSKIEYMKCDFSATTQEEGDVRHEGQVVPKKDTFHYLGSMLQKDGYR
jgi:hypothetical protein